MNEKYEPLGQAIDTLDNLTNALDLPLDDAIHVEQLRLALPELVAEMKQAFAAATGDNPWSAWEGDQEEPGPDRHEPLD